MRVSTIFAQGGHHGHGDDCGHRCYDDCGDDYYNHRRYYYNGFNDRHHEYDYDDDRGLLSGLLGG